MFLKSIIAALGTTALLASGLSYAAENPSSLSGGAIVSADQAKSLIDKGATAIDVRTSNEFAESHIKGAKLVPYKEKSVKAADFDATKDEFDLGKMPSDKGTAVVLYCNGLDCWKSYKASVVAIKAGYTKVNWLRGGLPEWKGKGLPTE